MSRKILFIGLILIFTGASIFADTTEVVIGSPANGNVIPFWGGSYPACRFQALYLQSEINIVGKVVTFSFMPSLNVTSNYNAFRVYFCHTNVTQLSTTFDNNYGGNTPVKVIDDSSRVIGGTSNQWMDWNVNFDYNNRDNLLLEVRWRGSGGINVPIYRNAIGSVPRRIWAWDDAAVSGTVDNVNAYYAKIRFFVPTGVEEKELESSKVKMQNAKLWFEVYPNPVTSKANLRLQISDSRGQSFQSSNLSIFQSSISIKIYDVAGKLVREINMTEDHGQLSAVWDTRDDSGRKVSGGVYFLRFSSGNFSGFKKILVLR